MSPPSSARRLAAFPLLALAMMDRDGEKQPIVGLGWAATQVEPEIARQFPALADDAAARHEQARRRHSSWGVD